MNLFFVEHYRSMGWVGLGCCYVFVLIESIKKSVCTCNSE